MVVTETVVVPDGSDAAFEAPTPEAPWNVSTTSDWSNAELARTEVMVAPASGATALAHRAFGVAELGVGPPEAGPAEAARTRWPTASGSWARLRSRTPPRVPGAVVTTGPALTVPVPLVDHWRSTPSGRDGARGDSMVSESPLMRTFTRLLLLERSLSPMYSLASTRLWNE